MKIDQGKNDGYEPKTLLKLINEVTDSKDINVGDIEVTPKFTFFDVDKDQIAKLITAFANSNKAKGVSLNEVKGDRSNSSRGNGGGGDRDRSFGGDRQRRRPSNSSNSSSNGDRRNSSSSSSSSSRGGSSRPNDRVGKRQRW